MSDQNEILDENFINSDGFGNNLRVEYAGFWIRVGAALVDALVMLPLLALNFYNLISLKSLPIALIIILLTTAYKPIMEGSYSATLGKMAFKIKVVDLHFQSITMKHAWLRYAPWILTQLVTLITTFLIFSNPEFQDVTSFLEIGVFQSMQGYSSYTQIASLATLVSVIWLLFNDKKQGLHDMLADTYCVYK